MTVPYKKLDVATELLDRALRLYYEGGSNFAVLHLAGAAEEILGVYAERSGRESSFKNMQRSAVKISKRLNGGLESKPKDIAATMNHAKNRTKHMDEEDDDYVYFDPKVEAHEILDRAVSNYYTLMGFHDLPETVLVRQFNMEIVGTRS